MSFLCMLLVVSYLMRLRCVFSLHVVGCILLDEITVCVFSLRVVGCILLDEIMVCVFEMKDRSWKLEI